MLKTKTKAFKPKGPSKPRPPPSREPTTEPTVVKDPIPVPPSAKRKEREEDDLNIEPPAKRIPIPAVTTATAPEKQINSTAIQEAPEPSQHPLPTPALTPTEVPRATHIPQTPPAQVPASPRKQLPSSPAVAITTSGSSSLAKQPTPTELPSAVDEVPSRSTSGASLGPAGGAILSAPTAALFTSRPSPPSNTNASVPLIRSTPRGSLGATGTSIVPTPLARSVPKSSLGPAGNSVVSASPVQSPAGGSLGPAGGSVITNFRNQIGAGAIAPALGPAGDVGEESDAGPSRLSQLVPMAALNPDGTPGGIIETPVKKKKRTVRRKQAKAATDDERATLELQMERPRLKKGTAAAKKVKEKKKRKKKEKPVRKRDDTPESAEDEMVDPTVLTMSELCTDLRIGKKFSRHNDIKERIQKQKEAVKAARAARNNPQAAEGGQEAGEAGAEGGSVPDGNEAGREPVEPAPEAEPVVAAQSQGILMRIVDGQIVVDERSTQLDRHREGQANEGSTEVIEENDFTKITTSGTLMKREKKYTWDWAAMEMFYKGLRTFGTDFGMIANMFPHRSRKQIKSRFNMEERDNPERINRVLSQPQLPLDFQEYEELSQGKYAEVSEIQAESQALEDEHNATQAASAAELAAAVQKKKDIIRQQSGNHNPARDFMDNLSDGEDDHGSSAKENRPSGSRSREQSAAATASGRRKKGNGKAKQGNKHSMRAGGEEFEIVAD